MAIERKLLEERRKLIDSGTPKENISVRNLELCKRVAGELVPGVTNQPPGVSRSQCEVYGETKCPFTIVSGHCREKCSLCFITETWLQDQPSTCFQIPNFSIIRHDRSGSSSDKARGGGVALFYNSKLNVRKIDVPEGGQHEILWTVYSGSIDILFCTVYYPPAINKQTETRNYIIRKACHLIQSLQLTAFVLCGDFNDLRYQ